MVSLSLITSVARPTHEIRRSIKFNLLSLFISSKSENSDTRHSVCASCQPPTYFDYSYDMAANLVGIVSNIIIQHIVALMFVALSMEIPDSTLKVLFFGLQ